MTCQPWTSGTARYDIMLVFGRTTPRLSPPLHVRPTLIGPSGRGHDASATAIGQSTLGNQVRLESLNVGLTAAINQINMSVWNGAMMGMGSPRGGFCTIGMYQDGSARGNTCNDSNVRVGTGVWVMYWRKVNSLGTITASLDFPDKSHWSVLIWFAKGDIPREKWFFFDKKRFPS